MLIGKPPGTYAHTLVCWMKPFGISTSRLLRSLSLSCLDMHLRRGIFPNVARFF